MKILLKILKYITITILIIIFGVLIWFFWPNPNSDFNDTPRESTKYWKLLTDSKIAYTHIKSKTDSVKSTIIYLHGGPGGYISDLTINAFEEISKNGYDVYLYDQIGSGLSERLNDPKEYTLQRHTEDLNEIIKTIKANNITLVGQSWGGFLAAYYATMNPKSIDNLILTSPGAIKPTDTLIYENYKPNSIEGLTSIDDRVRKINEEIGKNFTLKEKLWLAVGQTTANTNVVSDEKVDGILHGISKIFVAGMVSDTTNVSKPKGRPGMYSSIFTNRSLDSIPIDIRPKMKEFTSPVLILKPEYDYLDWREAYEYKVRFPNAKLKVIKGAGHSILFENSTDYIYEVLNFLKEDE